MPCQNHHSFWHWRFNSRRLRCLHLNQIKLSGVFLGHLVLGTSAGQKDKSRCCSLVTSWDTWQSIYDIVLILVLILKDSIYSRYEQQNLHVQAAWHLQVCEEGHLTIKLQGVPSAKGDGDHKSTVQVWSRHRGGWRRWQDCSP